MIEIKLILKQRKLMGKPEKEKKSTDQCMG